MLSHKIEVGNEDPFHKKELEMELVKKNDEIKGKDEHSQEEKIIVKKNLHFDCSHCQKAHELFLNYVQNLPEWLKKSYTFV